MPLFIDIADIADTRLEPYRNVRDRDLRGRGNAFIAEGQTVLQNAAPRSRHVIRSVLAAQSKAEKLTTVLNALPETTPVYVAPPDVMDEIAGFHIHRGILSHGIRSDDPGIDTLLSSLPEDALIVAAFGIANHDNLGGIFRNAVAFGADAVLLDPACCDPFYRKAIRVSVGASLICPFSRADHASELIESLAVAGFEAIALAPNAPRTLSGFTPKGKRIALCVGAEGPGLPDDVIARAIPVSIGMAPGFDSLNAATATGIALHAVAGAMGRI